MLAAAQAPVRVTVPAIEPPAFAPAAQEPPPPVIVGCVPLETLALDVIVRFDDAKVRLALSVRTEPVSNMICPTAPPLVVVVPMTRPVEIEGPPS